MSLRTDDTFSQADEDIFYIRALTPAQKAAKVEAHEQKIKDKATVVFSTGALKRLDNMGLHGKARQSAKKYHKNIMLGEMKRNHKDATKGIVVYVL